VSALGSAPAVSPRQHVFTIQASQDRQDHLGNLIHRDNGAEVRRASEWLDTACCAEGVPRTQTERLGLCLHEVLANIISHGGPMAHTAPIRLLLDVKRDDEGGKISLTVSDAGVPFNPVTAPERQLPKTLDEAPVGGLGLVMIRRFADELTYRHEDGQNHLTFSVGWGGNTSAGSC